MLTDAGQLVIPLIIRSVVDSLSAGRGSLQEISREILVMLLIAVAIALGRVGWRLFIHGASRRIEYRLRDRIFRHVMTLSSKFYGDYRIGDLMARFTNDMQAIRMAVGMAVVAFVDGIFITLAVLVILFSRYPRIAWMVILPLPVVTFLVIGAGKLLGDRFKKVQEGFSSLSEWVQESLSGIRVIKSFARESWSGDRFRKLNQEYRRRNMNLIKIWGLLFPMVTFLSGLSTLLLLYIGGMGVMKGSLTVGDFTAMLSYLQMLIWPMLGAGFTVNFLQRGAASLGRINGILREEPEIKNIEEPLKRKPKGGLRGENITFTYPGANRPALKDVSFNLEAGAVFGIIGKVGSGKSTFIRLLPRLLELQEGKLEIDGRDIRQYDLKTLRSVFGIVPQRSFLFSVSIRDNLAYGRRHAQDDELKRYADRSTISRDFSRFPEGWNTQVGEKGVSLSGGQKQRLAISRALAVQPDIFIFDDALSAVDAETEEQIIRSFLESRKGRTMIIVSNRVSTLREADHIIVLDDGHIVQQGTHLELIAREGFYRDIYRLQGSTPKGNGGGSREGK